MFYMSVFMMSIVLVVLFTLLGGMKLRRMWLPGIVGFVVGLIVDYIAVQLEFYDFLNEALPVGGVATFHALTVGSLSMIIIPLWPDRLYPTLFYLSSISLFIVVMEYIGISSGNFIQINWNYGASYVVNILVLVVIFALTKLIGALIQPSKAFAKGD